MFGGAKAFRDFKGILWYDTTPKNKARMTAISSLCLLPSWLLVTFQSSYILFLQQGGIDEYLFNAIHMTSLYFVVFGVLPKSLFNRWDWINTDLGYSVIGDDEIKIDTGAPQRVY